MKKLMLGTALSALIVSAALAQAPAPQPDTAAAPSTSASAPAAQSSGTMNFVASQKPEQFLASKFKGIDVVGTDNAKIGDVSDLLFDKDGKIEAYVVSVGGFLGVGSKDVAIAPNAFEVVKGTSTEPDKLKLSATKDQLKQAQNFEPYQQPRATTGSGAGGGTGMGGTMNRSTNTPPAGSR